MASDDLGDELQCSICRDIYTDPVTLSCGHNFCQNCIEQLLVNQQQSGVYTCPTCRTQFLGRPSFHINTDLNIAKRVARRSDAPQQDGGCPMHGQSLDHYCFQDSSRVCVSCSRFGPHRGHEVVTLSEASERIKENLRGLLEQLVSGDETEKRVQSLQDHRRIVQEKSATLTESVTVLFQEIEGRLAELKQEVFNA